MKRFLTIVLAVLTLFSVACISSCQSMDDIIPEVYGEWDGNYIYRGNGRSKTTGEEYEQLIESVEVEGETYYASACVDSKIVNDDVYMILACQEDKPTVDVEYHPYGWDSDLDLTYCLVVYNIQNKTQKLLFTEQIITCDNEAEMFYRPSVIEGVFGETIVLRAYVQNAGFIGDDLSLRNYEWCTVDLDGNLLDFSFEYLVNSTYETPWEWVSDEYGVADVYEKSGRKLYYRDHTLSEPILFYTHSTDAYSHPYEWSYVEQDGRKGVLIEEYYRVESNKHSNQKKVGTLRFYDFETNQTSSISIDKHALFYMDNRYVKTYDYTTIEYYETWFEKKTADVEINNAIYRLTYDENGVHLENFFDLPEEHRFTIYGIQEDKMAYCEVWYENPHGCDIFGGSEAVYVEHDLLSGEKRTMEFEDTKVLEDEYAAVYEKEKGVAVGDYIYFLHEETLQALMSSPHTAYQLKRLNKQTNELEIMQLWYERKNHGYSNLELKYCEDLWFTCGYFEYYDFYEFTIRSY